jgi:hypothetical protein
MNDTVSSVLYLIKSNGCEIHVSLPSLSRFPADYVKNPIAITLEQQTAIMDKCYRLIKEFTSKAPRGIVAP